MNKPHTLLCIKLGGSVITDKQNPYTAKRQTIKTIATSLKTIQTPLFIAHGVGSFAHTSAQKYGGKNGYTNKWGIAKVARDAEEINRIVMEIFIEAGLPAISFSPRSFLSSKNGKLHKSFFDPILQALNQGLIPVVYGDVIWDSSQKTTIFSGETTLNLISTHLQKNGYTIPQIIQLTNCDGVLDANNNVIAEITNKNWPKMKKYLKDQKVTDVTGGMKHKVEEALSMTKKGIRTVIINGNRRQRILHAVLRKKTIGTIIC